MSFKKDVKVYKKNSDGTFTSMVSKKDYFFRVYDIEKYNGKVFYWMSSGYRVEATNLVNFRTVPLEIRASFYKDPAYMITNRDGYKNSDMSFYYGDIISFKEYEDSEDGVGNGYIYLRKSVSFDKEYLLFLSEFLDRYGFASHPKKARIHGSDIKVITHPLSIEQNIK